MINVTGVIEVTTHNNQLPEASKNLMDVLWSLEDRINSYMHSEVVRWSGVSYSTVRSVAAGRYNINVKTIIALDVALDKLEWIAANAGNSRKMKDHDYLAMRQAQECSTDTDGDDYE